MLNTAAPFWSVRGDDGAAFVDAASSSSAATTSAAPAKQIGLDAMRRVDSKLDRKMMVQLFRERGGTKMYYELRLLLFLLLFLGSYL